MWSDRYWYYEIRGNASYSELRATEELMTIIDEQGVLQRKGSHDLVNKGDEPFISIRCVKCDTIGNYGAENEHINTNLIVVVTSKVSGTPPPYLELLGTIARRLNWELILEMDDDENEDVVLVAKETA
jgi:hypothetical protein